jgi:hypothetical protein
MRSALQGLEGSNVLLLSSFQTIASFGYSNFSNLADLGSSTGHNVRYVLAFGLGGIAFLIIGLYFYGVQF